MPPTPVLSLSAEERAPLSIAVARKLREAIINGQVPLGGELPSEKDLGKQLKVGRSTIREALRILQAQGLVTGGDTVSTARPRVTAELTIITAASTMENALRLGQVPLADLVELRVVIEGSIVEAAAEAGPSAALDEARATVETMRRPNLDVETFRAADVAFHRCLAAAAGNQAFTLVMGVLRDAIAGHLGEALHRVTRPRAAMAELTKEHAAILDAVVHGHGKKARQLITEHIRDFYKESSRS